MSTDFPIIRTTISSNRVLTGLLFMAVLFLASPASAENKLPTPNWDRELALQTSAMGSDEQQLSEWFRMLRAGESGALLDVLRKYSDSRLASAPVRERQLYLFTQGLADFPAAAIPAELMDLLESYTPETLVPGDENAISAVPLFNIPAAAKGLRHSMERQRGEIRSAQLLLSEPDNWIRAYLDASASSRGGFLDALDSATGQQLETLGQTAILALHEQPALSVVAARAASATGDHAALQYIIQNAHGPDLAPILRSAAGTLSQNEQAIALLSAIASAPAENAALAIALLAPGLHVVAEVTNSLFDLLEDPILGSAAALALSHHPDPAVSQQLSILARDQGAAAQRARLALALTRKGVNP